MSTFQRNPIMKKAMIIAAFGLFSVGAFAQTAAWNANYIVALPMGDTKEWIDNTSFRGVSIDGRSFVDDNFSIGGTIAWQSFYKKIEDHTISLPNADIYGTQFRYINSFNVTFDAHYYVGEPYSIRPYIGAGVGTYYMSQRGDLSLWSVTTDGWHFGVRPELGLFVPFSNSDYGINIGAKYNYIIKNSDSVDHQYLSINLGLLHML